MTEIVEVKDFIPAYTDAVQKLLEQLTNRPVKLTGTTLREIISQENTHLFFLLADQEIAGMLTVGIYHSPTGGKAWIEDVVVDEKYRGQGLSKQLVTHAVRFVKEQGIPLIMLTSNPTRIAANKLYQKLGFEQKPHYAPFLSCHCLTHSRKRSPYFSYLNSPTPDTDSIPSRS